MYKLWWSGKDAGFRGVGILVKKEIYGNNVEVRRKSDRVMAIVLTLGREVMHIICAYGPQSRKPGTEKVCFRDEMASKWNFGSYGKIIVVSLENFNGHVGKCAESFEGVHKINGIEKKMQKEGDCWSFVMKENCAWQTLGFIRQTKGKLLIVLVHVKQKLILCLQEKIQKYVRDVKVILWELQHRLVVVEVDKKILKRIVRQ